MRLWLLDTQGRGGEHNAALATVGVPAADGTVPGIATPARTKITAVITGRRLRVSGTVMRSGRVRVSWRSKRATRTLGAGSRVVSIRKHKIALTFTLSAERPPRHDPHRRALGHAHRRAGPRPPPLTRPSAQGTPRIAVRSGTRIFAQVRARRAR